MLFRQAWRNFWPKVWIFLTQLPFLNLFFNFFFRWILLWTCRLQFEPPALKFRQKNQRFFTNSQHLWNKKKIISKKTLQLKMFLWLHETSFEKNCWIKSPGVGKFFAPRLQTFNKHKFLAKSKTQRCSTGTIWMQIRLRREISAHFFSLPCPQKRFNGNIIQDTFWQPAWTLH